MQTVYFLYSDIGDYESWHLRGIFTEKEIAEQYMLEWAEQEHKDHQRYCEHIRQQYGEGAVIETLSFEAFLAKEYKIIAKQVIETLEDAQRLTCRNYIVDLATGDMELTTFGLDFESKNELNQEPYFLGSEKIAIQDDTCDCVWVCGRTKEDALAKLKKWLKERLKQYPVEAVKPCQALLE